MSWLFKYLTSRLFVQQRVQLLALRRNFSEMVLYLNAFFAYIVLWFCRSSFDITPYQHLWLLTHKYWIYACLPYRNCYETAICNTVYQEIKILTWFKYSINQSTFSIILNWLFISRFQLPITYTTYANNICYWCVLDNLMVWGSWKTGDSDICPILRHCQNSAQSLNITQYIWRVSPQLSCGDTRQIWEW